MEEKYRQQIAKEFTDCVDATIERISNGGKTKRPFHTALLSEEVIFWSSFERSFSTSFGQKVIERIANIVVKANGATESQRQKETIISIDEAYDNAINKHKQNLRDNTCNARDWKSSLAEITSVKPSGKNIETRIISDLWWKKDGVDNYISLKTVQPNIDQTVVAKEDCLRLTINDPTCKTYFGLPYNPFGDNREDYCFQPPMRIFDFHHDSVVLIGKELWDTLGGSGCYEEILDIAQSVGASTKEKISKLY